MINTRSVAALGIGFGALAIASIGLLGNAVEVPQQIVTGGQARQVSRPSRAPDFILSAFTLPALQEPDRKPHHPARAKLPASEPPAKVETHSASLPALAADLAAANKAMTAIAQEAGRQIEQQKQALALQQEDDDEEAILLMLLASRWS